MDKGSTSFYSRHWDHYVDEAWPRVKEREGADADLEWPGDEWGRPAVWESVFRALFVEHGSVETWQKAVEIGQGSGKYTLKVLENPEVQVRAYDVSRRFLEVCADRCAEHVASGRLSPRLIDTSTPRFMLDDLADWKREVDAFYSIGTLVHVDLQYVIAYLIAAAAALKPGGKLIVTLGTVGSDAGFQRLLEDIIDWWPSQLDPSTSGKYEWLSGCLVESLLPRLGFDVDLMREQGSINLQVVATLARPETGDELVRYLGPARPASRM